MTPRKNLFWVLVPISLKEVSYRRLKKYHPKNAGPSCTDNKLALLKEDVEWLCLGALECMYCLQPQLSKPMNLYLPPGHAKQ